MASDTEREQPSSPRADGLGLPQFREIWLLRGSFVTQAWVGKAQSGKFPVYALTGEQSWGSEEDLRKSCLTLSQVEKSGLHVKRVAHSVSRSILTILDTGRGGQAHFAQCMAAGDCCRVRPRLRQLYVWQMQATQESAARARDGKSTKRLLVEG